MLSRPWRVRGIAAGATIVAVGLLAACGGSSGSGSSSSGATSSSGPTGVLTVATGATAYPDDFNLYSPNAEDATNGMIYEPLFFYNTAKAGDIKPWLGTSYAWSRGGKTLTVQLRHNVKWSDGQAFTSKDVVFTFDQALHSTAMNKFGLPLAGVTANGAYGVTITFTKPAYTDAYYALGRVEMLPEHIWQSVKNPTTFLNEHPVGTGAYVLSKFTPQAFELTANPHYYMPGLPHFKTVRFISYSGNTTLDAAIEGRPARLDRRVHPEHQADVPGQGPEVRGQRHPAGHHVPGAEHGHRADHQAGRPAGDQRRAEPQLHQQHACTTGTRRPPTPRR